ncbi:hypothetical protein LEP1GSC050_3988 [Leptospira broomii serovar Hurstbridge str. 5399]|uniref:Uncharacterized protein n=1 Tax=Leptospira broomii serovar Hurstbridge str. 5399 TaxID=1049789 RepID=T0GL94_9LEPT|nr:hypothetical protein LEP1GSC050_3988 [Leptospira broomii serovar Hurstbridge str. 5399]
MAPRSTRSKAVLPESFRGREGIVVRYRQDANEERIRHPAGMMNKRNRSGSCTGGKDNRIPLLMQTKKKR